MLPCILFEKYIYISALEMASPGNRHCAVIVSAHFRFRRLTDRTDRRLCWVITADSLARQFDTGSCADNYITPVTAPLCDSSRRELIPARAADLAIISHAWRWQSAGHYDDTYLRHYLVRVYYNSTSDRFR